MPDAYLGAAGSQPNALYHKILPVQQDGWLGHLLFISGRTKAARFTEQPLYAQAATARCQVLLDNNCT
jgi:hypothetical protein